MVQQEMTDGLVVILGLFSMPAGSEWIILLILGLLIFGRRLPEVGKSLGRGIVEFKKGIKGVEEEIEEHSSKPAADQRRLSEQRAERANAVEGEKVGVRVSEDEKAR